MTISYNKSTIRDVLLHLNLLSESLLTFFWLFNFCKKGHFQAFPFLVGKRAFRFIFYKSLFIYLELILRIIMSNQSQRHSSIHTIHLIEKKRSNHSQSHEKFIRPSTIIMNQLADARNQVYLWHLQEYYEQLQKIMQENDHKRIKTDMLSFIVFIITQLTLNVLKYFIMLNYNSSTVDVLIQIFSIISFFSGIYFISLHILNFGLQAFLKLSFCLDKLNLILLSICFVNSLATKMLGFSSSSTLSLQFFLPFWLYHSATTIRIQVLHYEWDKFQIILSKIVHLISFTMILVHAWQFVYHEQYLSITSNSNSYEIMLIYTIALALYFVQFYRLISNFDGTNHLRYDYQFQNNSQSIVRKKKKHLQQKLQKWKFNK